MSDSHRGEYHVAMSCTVAGTFSVNIVKIDKTSNTLMSILGSPFSFSVSPASVAPENIIITGQSAAPTVGNTYTVVIQEYDQFGNRILRFDPGVISGNLRGIVQNEIVDGSSLYGGNGSFSLSFMATISDQYMASIQYQKIDIGAARLLRSPFLVGSIVHHF